MKVDREAPADAADTDPSSAWDHGTNREFYDYYAAQSESPEAIRRARAARDVVLAVMGPLDPGARLDVADIGCGAGTFGLAWAEAGHRVSGLDVNRPLVELARERARERGLDARFEVGSATSLPWPDESMDVCSVPELLEHVAEWRTCLDEFTRILRPGGVLYLTTTNALCPRQAEFNLPGYSWYPGPLKRRYERLAVTTRPDIANHAKYPAVNWFTFYGLRAALAERGCSSLDRFDLLGFKDLGPVKRLIVGSIRALPPLRLAAHMATPGTRLAAIKTGR